MSYFSSVYRRVSPIYNLFSLRLLSIFPLGLILFLGYFLRFPTPVGAESPPIPPIIRAENPSPPPPELSQLLTQIDQAANQQDLAALMKFYHPNFSHTDGFNRQSLEKVIGEFWKNYSQLNYQTKVKSWQKKGSRIIAETVTTIQGKRTINGREITLESTIRSQIELSDNQLEKQEILAEKTRLTSGQNPPKVQINLPETIKVGEEYYFDAILEEPLGDDVLIGTVLEEAINEKNLLAIIPAELEVLNAGGLFKVGKAPNTSENRWISAVLMRGGGITSITQRLRVTN